MPLGSVALVGAGPGDASLITVRGMALLRGADVVVYDRLVSPDVLRFVAPNAERIFAGKAAGKQGMTQEQINDLLVQRARAGATVVRLKGGDPFVFGRGGEEAERLAAEEIPFDVVPGITSALAAPAAAGIPVTHRDVAGSVVIATAHQAAAGARGQLDWEAIARADTAVLLMGVERLGDVARALVDAGRDRRTPAAVIQDATLATQRTVVAPLQRIAAVAARAGIRAPAVIVVGDVVGLREALGGWDTRPLSGVSVLVTRTREQASELSMLLRELGAEVVEAPAIRVEPPRSWRATDRAVERLRSNTYDWVVFTSANGVRFFLSRVHAAGADARAFAGAQIAAVGPGTAETLAAAGLTADLVPASFTTAAVGEAFPLGTGRVLLARADRVEPGLPEAIAAKGWTPEALVAYRVLSAGAMPAPIRKRVLAGGIDVITFASGGTVRAFANALRGRPGRGTKIVCIGPVTAKAARAAGLRVHAVAPQHTIAGLAASVVDVAGPR